MKLVHGSCEGPCELSALGPVAAPAAVLLRPDGYVAWVGASAGDGPWRR
ncbi:hypothetical protein [Variovorax sp. CAN15]